MIGGFIDIIGGGGHNFSGDVSIAGSLNVGRLVTPYANTVTVAKSGGDYTSIQDAINSINDAADDNRYAVVVYPGVYTENIVMKNYVNLVGLPDRRGARIFSTSGTLLTMPTVEAHLTWIDLYMEPTSTSDKLIDATAGAGATGFYRIENTDIRMTMSTDIKPYMIDSNVGTGIYFINTTMTYISSNTGITGNIVPVNLQSGNVLFYLLRSILRSTIGSSSANVRNVVDAGTGRILKEICTLQLTCTHASYSGTATPYYITGGNGASTKQLNNVVIECTGAGSGTSYVAYYDSSGSSGVLNASRNVYDISGFANNRRYYIASGDTILSYFNRHIADMDDVKNGSLREIDVYNNDDFIVSEKIGLGTESPDSAVHVASSEAAVSIEGSGGSKVRWDLISHNDGSFSLYDSVATNDRITLSSTETVINEAGASVDFRVEGDTQTNLLFVDASQDRIGIGTNNPEYGSLQIKAQTADASGGLTFYQDSGSTSRCYLKSDGASNFNWHFVRGADDDAGIIISQSGNVGVGEVSPNAKLHVYHPTNNTNMIIESGDTLAFVGFVDSNSTGDYFHTVVGCDGDDIVFYTSNSEDMRIQDGGNVAIGHTSPDTILDINGAFTFRELSSDPSNPDEGAAVLWMSDGTGSGDDGDIMMKITAGASTKTVTLVDFSAA